MTEEEFAEILALGHENTRVEFKGPGPRTDELIQSKVIKAAMGMSNRRDGGLVIIGVGEAGGALIPTGLGPTDLKTWQHDHIASLFALYADPSIEFSTETADYQGNHFIVLRVSEFYDVPVLCKKEFPYKGKAELILGSCYVRSRRKPETVAVATVEDMRELIELATGKALRRWFQTGQAAGITFASPPPPPSSSAQFNAQLGGL